MSTTYASVTIQDIEYTERKLGLDVTITYVADRVGPGASVITKDEGQHLIEVHIDPTATDATDVATAVNTDEVASSWVNAEITGTAENLQLSVVNAPLTGGTVAVKARKDVGPLSFMAVTAGAAGNSIRVKYVNAGSISVSVSSSDITVNFINNSSMAHAVAAAINASGPASALVKVHARGKYPMLVAHAADFTALAGGADAAPASLEVQDLTFTSVNSDASDNGKTITYTDTATAGSEVVTDVAGNVSIAIESGVSTATQIKAAFDASTAATGTITVVDWEDMIERQSEPSGPLTFGSPNPGDTVSVFDPVDEITGVFTCVAADPGADEFVTAAQLAALIDAMSNFTATDDSGVITVGIDAGAWGPEYSLATVTGTGTFSALNITFSGGRASTEVIVGENTIYVGRADLTPSAVAETSNAVTATNIAAALDALDGVSATAEGDVVSISATGSTTFSAAFVVGGIPEAPSPEFTALELSGETLDSPTGSFTCTISGTGSDAQITVNEAATSGAYADSGTGFYMDSTMRTIKANFFEYQFGFVPSRMRIKNTDTEGTNALAVSFDRSITAALLAPGEEFLLESGDVVPHAVSLKYVGGAPSYSIEASAIGPNLTAPTEAEED
jgi:hypothetical protein